jgi:hypothetical protein
MSCELDSQHRVTVCFNSGDDVFRRQRELPMIDRLASMDVNARNRLSWAMMGMGIVALAIGVVVAHYALFPETVVESGVEVAVEVDYLGWIPRGWIPVTIGQLVAFGGSQLMILAAVLLWVADKKMTWARAGFLAWLVWIEFVLIFGVVPSEWLNLTQGPFGWTRQRIAFEIPPWLVLNNSIEISYAVIKDAVSGAYNIAVLGFSFWFAYRIQDWGRAKPEAATEAQTSPYGRPLIKGES